MALLDAGFDRLKYELQEETRKGARIKVVGVGGGGSNAVARMIHEGLEGVEFHIMNTDVQALEASIVPNKLQIGVKITGGLGAGSDPADRRATSLRTAIRERLEPMSSCRSVAMRVRTRSSSSRRATRAR